MPGPQAGCAMGPQEDGPIQPPRLTPAAQRRTGSQQPRPAGGTAGSAGAGRSGDGEEPGGPRRSPGRASVSRDTRGPGDLPSGKIQELHSHDHVKVSDLNSLVSVKQCISSSFTDDPQNQALVSN